MNALIFPFPVEMRQRLNEFGETPEEQRRRECLALLEDSFGRDFADTMGAMSEAETAEGQAAHAEWLERLSSGVTQ